MVVSKRLSQNFRGCLKILISLNFLSCCLPAIIEILRFFFDINVLHPFEMDCTSKFMFCCLFRVEIPDTRGAVNISLKSSIMGYVTRDGGYLFEQI